MFDDADPQWVIAAQAQMIETRDKVIVAQARRIERLERRTAAVTGRLMKSRRRVRRLRRANEELSTQALASEPAERRRRWRRSQG